MSSYLNIENIKQSNTEIEFHPLKPCIDANTEILFLGSFPPPRKKWAKNFDFFYPNFINDHWRIMGKIFYDDKDYFVDNVNKTFYYNKVIAFITKYHIGYFDTAQAVHRLKNNASDKFLRVLKTTDMASIISIAKKCQLIITTGEKATSTLCQEFGILETPSIGSLTKIPRLFNFYKKEVLLCRLPSSSRAYPLPFEKKVQIYSSILV